MARCTAGYKHPSDRSASLNIYCTLCHSWHCCCK